MLWNVGYGVLELIYAQLIRMFKTVGLGTSKRPIASVKGFLRA